MQPMKPLVPLLVAIAFLAAGCVNTDPAPTPTTTPPPPMPDYSLDCTIAPGMGGSDWPEACLGLASENDSPSKAEVDLAVNPTDPLNVVVASKDKDPLASNSCVWSVAHVTKDGGKTWTTVYIGGTRSDREPETLPYECVTDPIMEFDADGTFYYALQIYDHTPRGSPNPNLPDTGSAFILARSQDGGLTYDRYVVQAEGLGDIVFHDYPRMIVNPATQSIHAIWNAYVTTPGASNIYPVVSSSRDGGQTVDPPLILRAPEGPASPLGFFSGFAATRDGTIYVTMAKEENSDAGDATKVWIWKSVDDARTFTEVGEAFTIQPTPRQHGDHEYRTPSFAEMAIDASDGNFSGRIYVFWPEWSDVTKSDILVSSSDDGGVTWRPPVNVASQTEGDQVFMRPAVGPDGTVHVLFATQAYSGGEALDQVHAWSRNGGANWTDERLTTVSFDGDLGIHQDDFPFIGDYNGLKVGPDGVVHAAWGDTSTGRAEIAYARIVPNSG